MNISRKAKSATARTVLLLTAIIAFGIHAPVAIAQGDKWDPNVPGNLFKDEQTADKKPKTKHRLAPAPPECPECKAAVDALQAALDDWYAMQQADAEALKEKWKSTWHSGGELPDGAPTEKEVNKQKDAALEGLGQPADGGKAAKKKQGENAKAKKDTHGTKGKLKDEIKRLTDALKKCLEDCKNPKEEVTPTPTSKDKKIDDGSGTAEEAPPALPKPTELPTPPPCFDTEDARNAFLAKCDSMAKDERTAARQAREMFNLKYQNKPDSAWGTYWKKKQEIHEKSLQDLDKISSDAADPKKTPVPCPKKEEPPPPGKKGKTATGGGAMLPKEIREEFCSLIEDGKINVDFTGTGETCGHVADCKINNLTDGAINCVIPPMILESKSGKNQDYACPGSETVDVGPKSSKNVPIEGVCLVRNKPPVNKDSGNDLKINNCDGDNRIPDDHADTFLGIATSIFQAAEELLKDGDLKEIPYKDPEKKKDIVVQWATWADPRISEMTGTTPATKEDLKKVVYKQVEEKGPMTPETKEKVDQGIDTIFEKIELTTKKAKDLEKSNEANPPQMGGGTVNISNDTPTPGPGTQEKPKKDKKKGPGKKWPKPVQDWVDKKKEAIFDNLWKQRMKDQYDDARRRFFEKNKQWQALNDKANEAAKKAFRDETKENADNANKARAELGELEKKLGPDFDQTEDGKQRMKDLRDAEKRAQRSDGVEKEAGKSIDESTKAIVEANETWPDALPAVW